jgi:hypothetical protein
MRFESPAGRRSKVEQTAVGYSIVIPARKQWLTILFMLAWLGGWVVGEITVLRQLISEGRPDGATAFMLFWLCGWTLGGLWAMWVVLWMIAGTERITIDRGALVISRQVLGIGRPKSFDLGLVKRLRVDHDEGAEGGGSRSSPTPLVGVFGAIAFDYGAKTIRFATGVEEAEAAMIIDELRSRYSFHGD